MTPEPTSTTVTGEDCRDESVCGVFVTYNPSQAFYENVLALANQVSTVIIVDNASNPASQPVLQQVTELAGVEVIRNRTNLGIGAGLNIGVTRAMQRGFTWVATFDQDSWAGPGFIRELLRTYAARRDRSTIALLAPRYQEAGLELLHDEVSDSERGGELVPTTMMSGNLVRTEAIERVGLYDERLFIDYVDHEFCLRLARHGYRVLKCEGSVLLHQLGRISQSRIGGMLVATTNHSPLRRYYNARNRILVYRRHWGVAPRWVVRDLRSFAVETLKIVLLEQERSAKLANVARGIWHGLSGNLREGPVL